MLASRDHCRRATWETWPRSEAVDSTGHEMRMRAWVQCMERQGRLQGGNCFARVDVLRAPKGQLNALVSLFDSHNLVQDHPTQEWMSAYMNRQQQIANGQMQQLRRNEEAGNAALAQNAQNAKASSQMLHNQYLSSSQTLKRRTRSRHATVAKLYR